MNNVNRELLKDGRVLVLIIVIIVVALLIVVLITGRGNPVYPG